LLSRALRCCLERKTDSKPVSIAWNQTTAYAALAGTFPLGNFVQCLKHFALAFKKKSDGKPVIIGSVISHPLGCSTSGK